MATPKQISYIKSLMIQAGYAHPKGGMNAQSKRLPIPPNMRERSGSVENWATALTPKQASATINYLKSQ